MMPVSEIVINRRNYITEWLESELKPLPVTVSSEDDSIFVKFHDTLISGIQVGEEAYKLFRNVGCAEGKCDNISLRQSCRRNMVLLC